MSVTASLAHVTAGDAVMIVDGDRPRHGAFCGACGARRQTLHVLRDAADAGAEMSAALVDAMRRGGSAAAMRQGRGRTAGQSGPRGR